MRSVVWLAVSVLAGLGFASARPASAQPGLPYPAYTPYQIKAIGAELQDEWLWDQMIGNNTGGMITNITWANVEPVLHYTSSSPCDPAIEEEYAGRCFRFGALTGLDRMIQRFSDAGPGRRVTGILVTVPDWARVACNLADQSFCRTSAGAYVEYGVYAGYIAHHYDGQTGHGRIANFVIHNEVNTPSSQYSDACGVPGPYPPTCSIDDEVANYARDWNIAYDFIKWEQNEAKVFASMGAWFNAPDNPYPGGSISLKTYLTKMVPLVGSRELKMALHAINPPGRTEISADDEQLASIGAIGKVTGWLRQTFPTRPSIWEVHLTEQGIYADPDHNFPQADALCQAFRNVLGTPGVEEYFYTPAASHVGYHNQELVFCNLQNRSGDTCDHTTFGTTWEWRPSWGTWASANRIDVSPPNVSCGFEVLPYVKFSRYSSPRGHFATTRLPPAGSTFEGAWKLLRDPSPTEPTHLMYECRADSGSVYQPGGHSFVDATNPCPSILTPWGPLGYIYDNPAPGRVAINRCYVNAPGWEDHFVGTNCAPWVFEETLGYAEPF